MKYDISVVSTYALKALAGPFQWTVHSVYRKTVNLQAGSRLLALQAAFSPQSPISLITGLAAQDFNGLGIMAGQPVTVEGALIRMEKDNEGKGSAVSFSFRNSDIFDSQLRKEEGTSPLGQTGFDTGLNASMIRRALELSGAGGFRALFVPGLKNHEGNDFLMNAAAQKRLQASAAFLKSRDYEGAAGALASLIGLGIGLTPSGDDFLCGVLAGFILSGRASHPLFSALTVKIEEHLSDTNDISRAFLQCALEYHFSKPVKELPGADTAEGICRSFEEIGHSSGMDTLCGVLFALSCP